VKYKKLLIGLTYYHPNVSGLSNYAKILAESLSSKYEITIISSRFNKNLKKREIDGNIKIIRSPGFKSGKGIIMPFYIFDAFLAVIKNDIINIHLPSIESFWLAFFSKIFNKKIIITYHCHFESKNKFLEKIIELTHNSVLKKADKIVVNSIDYIEGNKLLINFRDKLIEIYPPIINKEITTTEKEEIESKLKNTNKVKIIGFLGRISEEKNIETLIKTIPFLEKKIDDFKIVLAGADNVIGEEKYIKKINGLVKKYSKRIIKIGKIDNPKSFYKKCDCLVLPSVGKLESFGMVQAEAMICGIATICCDLPGIRVPIQVSGFGKLFKPSNAFDLSQKIIEVLKNGKKRTVDKQILDLFDYKKTIYKYEDLFN